MYIVITASPNSDGLTAACGKAALDGVKQAGGQAELYDIKALEPCRVCGNGWGSCRDTSKCVIGDVLPELQAKLRECQGVFLVTPVYFGQPAERMKYFLDRFRRCEAFNHEGSAASGKQFDLIAAAGGSGNGTATCLTEMESWCRAVGAIAQERIGVTRFNREPALKLIEDAAARMVKGEYFTRF
ncbi:MAG: flavodoxin family protein [Oscillospiraceae bacterium]|jgi:multimeric flavodoxin WrbA|nr:flavodoxin family protein [Oscillospiraceae bacterium]